MIRLYIWATHACDTGDYRSSLVSHCYEEAAWFENWEPGLYRAFLSRPRLDTLRFPETDPIAYLLSSSVLNSASRYFYEYIYFISDIYGETFRAFLLSV